MTNFSSPFWIKPKNSEIIPHSELACHAGAAGRFVVAYCRTGNDYAHVLFGDKNSPSLTHGLISEVLTFQGEAYNDCKNSAIVSQELLF